VPLNGATEVPKRLVPIKPLLLPVLSFDDSYAR